jgi:hypothetical protein
VHQLLAENVVANIETLQKKIGLLTRKWWYGWYNRKTPNQTKQPFNAV